MNSEEREAFIGKIQAICGEHCVAFVFSAEVDCDEFVEGAHESVMIGCWGGGLTLCTGLAHRQLKQIQATKPIEVDGEDEKT
jgi:hypothetical protein